MLFSLLKHCLNNDAALKASRSVYCFTTSVSHGVENYFPRLWGTGISDAIIAIFSFMSICQKTIIQLFSVSFCFFHSLKCSQTDVWQRSGHPILLLAKESKLCSGESIKSNILTIACVQAIGHSFCSGFSV